MQALIDGDKEQLFLEHFLSARPPLEFLHGAWRLPPAIERAEFVKKIRREKVQSTVHCIARAWRT